MKELTTQEKKLRGEAPRARIKSEEVLDRTVMFIRKQEGYLLRIDGITSAGAEMSSLDPDGLVYLFVFTLTKIESPRAGRLIFLLLVLGLIPTHLVWTIGYPCICAENRMSALRADGLVSLHRFYDKNASLTDCCPCITYYRENELTEMLSCHILYNMKEL